MNISLDRLRVSPYNVRRVVDEGEVRRLMESIASRGLQQPLVVMASAEVPGVYEVVIGRRRLEALRRLARESPERFTELFPQGVPCIVRSFTPREAMLASLMENLQRDNLEDDEVAHALHRLEIEHQMSPQEVVKAIKVNTARIRKALETLEALRLGYRIRGPGRPPRREKTEREITRKALTAASRIAELVAQSRRMGREEAEKMRSEIVKVMSGLSTKEVNYVFRRVRDKVLRGETVSLEEVKKAVKEVKAEQRVERTVLLPTWLIKSLEEYAERKGVTFDDALIEAAAKGLRELQK